MTETTPDPADTGTDRVELTKDERAQMNCDCAKPYDWDDHVDSCSVPVVESIVAARVEALTAERDALAARCAELENLLAACPQGEEGHACCDCPTPSEARLLSDYEQAHEDRMKEHAVVEELRTRCAELEDALDIVKRLNDEVGAERDELSREVVMRSDTVRDRLRKAEATLDRVTASCTCGATDA